MGKITSLIEFKGAVGNLVGYKGKDGRNVIRKRTWDPRNAKSVLQMRRRVQWANLVNIWKAIAPYMEPSFENKTAGQSDYNAYVQANVDVNRVFLTKDESRKGVTVAAPYILCRGTLFSPTVTMMNGGKMKSNIALGDLVIDTETTIGNFSKAIVDNNPDFREGDQITGLIIHQVAVGSSGLPRVRVTVGKVVLDINNTHKLYNNVPEAVFASTDGFLSTKSTVNGGCAWIVSRIVDGKTLVSTTQLMVNNNILSYYTSGDQQNRAMVSYGVKEGNYLTPTGDAYAVNTEENPEP